MKKLITILCVCLLSIGALALKAPSDILVIWVNQSATSHDKLAIRDALTARFNSPTTITAADYPTWYKIANPTVKGWAMVVPVMNLKRLNANPNNYTKAAFNNWKDANLDNPSHLQVERGGNWRVIQADEGMATE
jgi:hypothetical protein